MDEVLEFLQKVHTYYLATVDGDQPHVRPMGTSLLFEGKLYIQTGRSKDMAHQILANPKVEICAYDSENGAWLRIAGQLLEDNRREAKAAMLDANPQLRRMYSEDDDNTLVLYFQDAVARFDSYGEEPRYVKF